MHTLSITRRIKLYFAGRRIRELEQAHAFHMVQSRLHAEQADKIRRDLRMAKYQAHFRSIL